MDSANLTADLRERVGSRHARKLRDSGKIPACIQGGGGPVTPIAIAADAFFEARRHHQHLFDITLPGGKVETALVNELQWEVLGRGLDHVEFRRVVRGQETTADVELEFSGMPKGGVLNHLVTHIKIKAEPQNIPDSIVVKIDGLEVGHPLFARDLVLPQGVKLGVAPDMAIAVIVVAKEEIAPAPVEAAAAATAIAGATPAAGAAPAAAAGAAPAAKDAKAAAPAKDDKKK
jgi:large subunit ribosomal protein L25